MENMALFFVFILLVVMSCQMSLVFSLAASVPTPLFCVSLVQDVYG